MVFGCQPQLYERADAETAVDIQGLETRTLSCWEKTGKGGNSIREGSMLGAEGEQPKANRTKGLGGEKQGRKVEGLEGRGKRW